MIIGIGADLLQIKRLEAAYERTHGRLAQRVLGDDELTILQTWDRLLSYSFCSKRGFFKSNWPGNACANDLALFANPQ
jgi:phosphopantetheinyl transferase (holo-ACP synthase)